MSEILPGQLLRLYLNFYEFEMLLYFTVFFLITVNNLFQIHLISFLTPKELNNRKIIDGNIQLGATFLSENWIYL